MSYQLSKPQKKIARIIMDKGLDKHYLNTLNDAGSILLKWKSGNFANGRVAYLNLFKSIRQNDKNIAAIYDDKGGSRWAEVMALQLADGVISIDDLKDFDTEVIDAIISMSRF